MGAEEEGRWRMGRGTEISCVPDAVGGEREVRARRWAEVSWRRIGAAVVIRRG